MTDDKTAAVGLANLPRDYTGLQRNVPPLGPPLPGDLGRSIVAAQNAGQAVTVSTIPTVPAVDPEEQRRIQEREAARLSKLFAGTSVRVQAASLLRQPFADGTTDAAPSLGASDGPPGASGGDVRQNGHDRKLAFVNSATDKHTVSPDRLQAPASPHVVQAGTLIAGALLTGIRSDLPGQITGLVTENVYDSPSGRSLLIPQGAKLIGTYDSQVTFGQSRVLLVWTRLILPNGSSIVLERQPVADAQGYSGLEGEVDNHWGELFKAALLSTLLSVGSEAAQEANKTTSSQRSGRVRSFYQSDRQPDCRASAQHPADADHPARISIRVIVNRDLVLAPYGQ